MPEIKDKYYYIITYGCQMNEHDSEMMAGVLADLGYKQAVDIEQADIILLNTCVVRENAELKLFGKLGSLKQYKRENPDLIIGVGGCMMQTGEAVTEIREKYPHVDLVFGTHNLHKLPELIREAKQNREQLIEIWNNDDGLIPDLDYKREDDHKAWVTIIRGCDNYCTYCIVPYVRGRERSRKPEEIVREVKKLVADGVKEVTLLGQNVNSYGQDLTKDINFSGLLQRLDRISGLRRLRYMTSHPRDFDRGLIKTISNSRTICEHFHLPVQAGSNRILNKMNRGYTREQYLQLVEDIRQEIPGASITTDFIVGFPGESEGDFEQTLELVERVRFDMAFTFSYSPRPGTPAARMEQQVEQAEKDRRLQQLMELQNRISREQNQRFVGDRVKVLLEGESKNNPETFSGRTRTNKLVIVPAEAGLKGQIIEVKIKEAKSWTLYGQPVTESN